MISSTRVSRAIVLISAVYLKLNQTVKRSDTQLISPLGHKRKVPSSVDVLHRLNLRRGVAFLHYESLGIPWFSPRFWPELHLAALSGTLRRRYWFFPAVDTNRLIVRSLCFFSIWTFPFNSRKLIKRFSRYIRACFKLCWKIPAAPLLQQPWYLKKYHFQK